MGYLALGFIAFVAMVLYILPIKAGIFTQGNQLGIPLSLAVLLYSIFHKQVNLFVSRLWSKQAYRVLLSVLGIAVIGALVVAAVLSVMMGFAANEDTSEADVAIVLGCATKYERPSLSLQYRLDEAYDFLCENPDARVIVTGGVDERPDAVKSEAQVMAEYLVDKGIASDRIAIEDKASNTRENLEYSYAFIGENENVAIISSDYHILRAKLIAHKMGYTVKGRGAATPWYTFLTYYTRELMALANEIVFEPW